MGDNSFTIVPPRKVPGLDVGAQFVSSLNGLTGDLLLAVSEPLTLDLSGVTFTLGVLPNYYLRTIGGTVTGNVNFSPSSFGPYGLKLVSGTADPSDTAIGAIYFNTSSGTLRVYTGSGWSDVAQSGALTLSVANGLFLRLDGSNDPLTGDLSMGSSVFRLGNRMSDPVSGSFGDVYYNATSHRLRAYVGPTGEWMSIAPVISGTAGRVAGFADSTSVGNSAIWQDAVGVDPSVITLARESAGSMVVKIGQSSVSGVNALSIDSDGVAGSTTAGLINLPASTSSARGIAFGADVLYRSSPSIGTGLRSSAGLLADTILGAALSGSVYQMSVGSSGTTKFRPQASGTSVLELYNLDAVEDDAETASVKIRIRNSADTDDLFTVDSGGVLSAIKKSFSIPHPTRPGMKLVYGSLEGPEHGVYWRGTVRGARGSFRVELPDYWSSLCGCDFTVILTPVSGCTVRVASRDARGFRVSRVGFWWWVPYSFDYLVIGAREDIQTEQSCPARTVV